MSTAARQEADRRRAKAQPWRKWYSLKAWKLKRAAQLARRPWCEPCKALGMSRRATIANHKIRHNGDPKLFWHGELESVCKPCHDAAIQKAEIQGFRPDLDAEGWPSDPAHPFNRPRKARTCPPQTDA